uniref:Uncharacterized protein n=1 Tax=Cucumis melo TaxID=3656 RepID=A0A9I9DLL2_CUCME
MAGGLVRQVMAEEVESYYDGYTQNPSTNAIITQQSNKMVALNTTTQHHVRSRYSRLVHTVIISSG